MEILLSVTLILLVVAVWFVPLVLLLMSDRTSGFRKVLWVLAFLFISWFAWVAYILLVPKREPAR